MAELVFPPLPPVDPHQAQINACVNMCMELGIEPEDIGNFSEDDE